MFWKIFNLFLGWLKWVWSYKGQGQSARYSVVNESFFGPFVPEIISTTDLNSLYRNTKEILKFRCNYKDSHSFSDSKQFNYLLSFHYSDSTIAKLLFKGCKEYMEVTGCGFIKESKHSFSYERDTYYLHCLINKCPIVVEVAPGHNILVTTVFFNVYDKKNLAAFEESKSMLEFALSKAADGAFVIPKKAETLIKTMRSFKKRYFKSNVKRGLVVLLYGNPGTGKTVLASLLSDYIIGASKFYTTNNIGRDLVDLGRSTRTVGYHAVNVETLTSDRSSGSRPCPEPDSMPIEILDEFDSFGSYMKENSLQKEMNNKLKTLLDSATGIVFLITNHIDEIDSIILRQGRVNCQYEVNSDFYSVEEKKLIFDKYKDMYEIDKELDEETVIGEQIVTETTLATIENNARLYSLQNYLLDEDDELV